MMDTRTQFESWVAGKQAPVRPCLDKTVDGDYYDGRIQDFWIVWNASRFMMYQSNPLPEQPILDAWREGKQIQFFVSLGYDSEWTDYTWSSPPDITSHRLQWRIKPT